MRIAVTLLLALFVPLTTAQAPQAYSARAVTVARVSEISASQATRRANGNGEILEVRAQVTAPAIGTKLPIEQIKLIGASSKDGSKTSAWELAPIGLGATWKGNCSYEFPDTLVKGGVGFGAGPALWLKRENEGQPAVLEFSTVAIEVCAAFLVPAGAAGPTSLRVAGQEFRATWQTSK